MQLPRLVYSLIAIDWDLGPWSVGSDGVDNDAIVMLAAIYDQLQQLLLHR